MLLLEGWQMPPFWQGQGVIQDIPSGQGTSQLWGVRGEQDPAWGWQRRGGHRVRGPNSQGAAQPRWAEAGTSGGVAGGLVLAGAGQVTALPVGARWAWLAAQGVGEARGTGADPGQGVTRGPMVALAALSTVWPP